MLLLRLQLRVSVYKREKDIYMSSTASFKVYNSEVKFSLPATTSTLGTTLDMAYT